MRLGQKVAGLRDLLKFDNWPALVFSRTFDRQTGLVAYRKGSLEILVDHLGGDENGTRACLVSDMYQRHLNSIAGTKAVRVLDLGANGGGFPLMLLLNGFDVVKAVCVEMNPPTCLRLRVNLATNLGNKAIGINAAVCGADAPAEIPLQATRGSTGLSMYTNQNSPSSELLTVPTTTIAALVEQHFGEAEIDICKIDIEGAEYDAIQSAPDSALRRIRSLIIEFHDPARTPSCLSRLRSAGFAEITGGRDPHPSKHTEVRVFRRAG